MTLLLKVAESKERRGNRKRLAAVRAKSRSNVSSIEMEKSEREREREGQKELGERNANTISPSLSL